MDKSINLHYIESQINTVTCLPSMKYVKRTVVGCVRRGCSQIRPHVILFNDRKPTADTHLKC